MSQRGALVVTGASTGIGRAAAVALADEGFLVFAGVRCEADGRRLEAAHDSIRALRLDVTRSEDIQDAVARVAAETDGLPLAGLLNNAGITVAGPLEHLSDDELRRQFDVNVFGTLAVTRAFLPALRESRGRIGLVGSVSGFSTTPLLGAYCMSKHAMEAMADALRMELAPAGIQVSLIQPGSVETPIWAKGEEQTADLLDSASEELQRDYGELLGQVPRMVAFHRSKAVPPEEVAVKVVHAFTAVSPKPRYLVGGNAGSQRVLSMLPTSWGDRILGRMMRKLSS